VKTNLPAVTATPTPRAAAPVVPASLHPAQVRTNAPSLVSPSKPVTPTVPPATNVLAAAKPAPEPARPLPRPSPTKGAEALTARPAEVEVTHVQSNLVVKPAQELTRASAPPSVAGSGFRVPGSELNPEPGTPNPEPASTNGSKRGLLSRLNPFAGKSKTASTPPADPDASLQPDTAPPMKLSAVPRYAYLSPAAPTAGHRAESEKAFKRGLKAQKAGHRAEAVSEYQAAVKADPANYDAYFNLGLAAMGGGETRLSLWAYEIALALKPEAEDARYNFALALKAGGYWLDATDQLKKLLATNPSDARVHLSLGNLYAQQLDQPRLAREYYLRVLELSPAHAEAAKIRYWLAANP
jgi:Tfp pilus assembly protein PilF